MADLLRLAEESLLLPAEITLSHLTDVLAHLQIPGIDYADLYFQAVESESWSLDDGIVKTASYHASQGIGVRALAGEAAGFAYCDEISKNGLIAAASAARSIARQGQKGTSVQATPPAPSKPLYHQINPLQSLREENKVALLRQIDSVARQLDPRVIRVHASLAGMYEVIYVAASDGTFAADIRPLVRLNVSVIVDDNGRRESGFCGAGGRYDYLQFNHSAERLAKEAVRQALVNLEAKPTPAGVYPVVLGSGWPGVLLHEAIGHGLEGDFNRKGTSTFTGRLGQRIATEHCTVVDDGTLPDRRGSLTVDDEGTPTGCTVLIENGILKNYMQDKLNARLMGMQPTGNGRRQSYAYLPLPRMTNTYMQPGSHHPDEIIASVERGIYAVNFGGGQVDITSGKFVFSMSEAYLIENGKITAPLKGATLIGHGPDVLTRVSMVGHDLALDEGIGICGKEGQSVPVGVGQPTLRIDAMTVGGTES